MCAPCWRRERGSALTRLDAARRALARAREAEVDAMEDLRRLDNLAVVECDTCACRSPRPPVNGDTARGIVWSKGVAA